MPDTFVAGPERPIRSRTEDLLDRSKFVERLCDAVINRETKRSTGVTIGLTGEWGSGKSSILNLLDERIKQRYPDAVIIRFDPWLVSGRDDLIRQFFLEFQASIKENPALRDRLEPFITKLGEYSSHLAPMINVTLPGGGDVLAGSVGIIQRVLSRDRSLHQQREDLMTELQELIGPFVVLVDELDRIEDTEIRAVAQLVRAVADFPNISYVLAYDAARVIQALGTGGHRERSERGRAYLEKIVQFQIKLPATLEDELEGLLNAELAKLQGELGLPENWQRDKRFRELIDAVIPHCITTARDIKRLVGTYHVIGSMVKGEVDWCDLLGFSVLMIKAPATVTKLTQQPDLVIEDSTTIRSFQEHYAQRELKPDERLAKFVPDEENYTGAVQLLSFLFPRFSNNGIAESRTPESLCYRRPLLTVLRLDILPDAFSADDIQVFLALPTDQIDQKLWHLYEECRLAPFLKRLDEVYSRYTMENHSTIWLGISRFLRREDDLWPQAYSPMRELPERFGKLFLKLCFTNREFVAEAAAIVRNMLDDGDVGLASHIVMGQAFSHGLFGAAKFERSTAFLTATESETLALQIAEDLRKRLLSANWIVALRDPQPLSMMLDVGVWDNDCQDRLICLIQKDDVFDAFMLSLFGGIYMVRRDFIAKLVDLDKYLERLRARLASASLHHAHPSVRAALDKASNRP